MAITPIPANSLVKNFRTLVNAAFLEIDQALADAESPSLSWGNLENIPEAIANTTASFTIERLAELNGKETPAGATEKAAAAQQAAIEASDPAGSAASAASAALDSARSYTDALGIAVANTFAGLGYFATGTSAAELTGTLPAARIADGSLPLAKVTGLVIALDGKQATLTAASEAEMEAGTETGIRGMSPLRVAQAIAALAPGGSPPTIWGTRLDPDSGMVYTDHFHWGNGDASVRPPWLGRITGATNRWETQYTATSTDGALGEIKMSAASSVPAVYMGLYNPNGIAPFTTSEGVQHVAARVRFHSTLPDATNDFTPAFGFIGHTETPSATPPTNGIYFRCVRGSNWQMVCRASGSETTVDTGIAATNSEYATFELVKTGTTSVQCYVNHVAVGSPVTTNIPTVQLGWFLGGGNVAGASFRYAAYDWFGVAIIAPE